MGGDMSVPQWAFPDMSGFSILPPDFKFEVDLPPIAFDPEELAKIPALTLPVEPPPPPPPMTADELDAFALALNKSLIDQGKMTREQVLSNANKQRQSTDQYRQSFWSSFNGHITNLIHAPSNAKNDPARIITDADSETKYYINNPNATVNGIQLRLFGGQRIHFHLSLKEIMLTEDNHLINAFGYSPSEVDNMPLINIIYPYIEEQTIYSNTKWAAIFRDADTNKLYVANDIFVDLYGTSLADIPRTVSFKMKFGDVKNLVDQSRPPPLVNIPGITPPQPRQPAPTPKPSPDNGIPPPVDSAVPDASDMSGLIMFGFAGLLILALAKK